MINAERVAPGPDTEAAIAALVAGEPATASLWEMTYQVLDHRGGWSLYVGEEGDYAWLFGWEGQGLLVVSVEPYGIDCYHHREDSTDTVNSARDLWEWITVREDDEEAKGIADITAMRLAVRQLSDERLTDELT